MATEKYDYIERHGVHAHLLGKQLERFRRSKKAVKRVFAELSM